MSDKNFWLIFCRSAAFLLLICTLFLPLYAIEVTILQAKGFPRDYAEKLAVLQRKHPNWQFEVLPVSRLEPKYTWAYIIYMETDNAPARSLVSANPLFSAYFHESDTKEYDAGCRRASTAAVAYFLDPRNFLNECDIFQFLNLHAPEHISIPAVEAALKNTFMANAKLENGQTYAEYICAVGKMLNIDPLFLASRMRQEQGLRGTPLVSGVCGTRLANYYQQQIQREGRFAVLTPADGFSAAELKKYDGLYNFFNMNASGTGRFTIYLNGMREAETGSPHMADQWGSPRWDTRWKAIYGGAWKISQRYIGNYQNTPYLQKWNVDPRCRTPKGWQRNFWGQYMQNIGAAFSESRNTYRALRQQSLLDLPLRFLIPVYSGMPPSPSSDPANGKCAFYRSYQAETAL